MTDTYMMCQRMLSANRNMNQGLRHSEKERAVVILCTTAREGHTDKEILSEDLK